jgi:excisionase family DNA binding protein
MSAGGAPTRPAPEPAALAPSTAWHPERAHAARTQPRPRLTRDDVLTVHEVAAILRLPTSTVFDYARRAVIPGHNLGRHWIFLRDEIEHAVRAAPSRHAGEAPPQPPGPRPLRTTRKHPKRYPETVPGRPTGSQARLFD